MLVYERLLHLILVAFAYFIHHGLELLLIPFKVLRLLDFVCRYRQRLRVLACPFIHPAVHELSKSASSLVLSLCRVLRCRAGITNGLLRQVKRQLIDVVVVIIEFYLFSFITQLLLFIYFAHLVILRALNSLHFEACILSFDIKMLRTPFANFRFALRRIQ